MTRQQIMKQLKDALTDPDVQNVKYKADWALCEMLLNLREHNMVKAWLDVMDRLEHLKEHQKG